MRHGSRPILRGAMADWIRRYFWAIRRPRGSEERVPSSGFARIQPMAPVGHALRHRPHESHRSTAIVGFSRRQSTLKVMQYFTHFAQQMLRGSKIASRGQTEIQSRQSVHFVGSMAG